MRKEDLLKVLKDITESILHSDLEDTNNIDCCFSHCLDLLNEYFKDNDEIMDEYFHLLEVIKKKKKSFDKKDKKRSYLNKKEKELRDIKKIYKTIEDRSINPYSLIIINWLNDENAYLYIKKLLSKKREVYNIYYNGKHIIFYILDLYIYNFKKMIEDRKSEYINKDYIREVYFLFTKNFKIRLSKEEQKEIDDKLNNFSKYIKTTLIKEKRKNVALTEIKSMKTSHFYKAQSNFDFSSFDDDVLTYEVNRILKGNSNQAKSNDLITDNAYILGNNVYKVNGNKISIYSFNIYPYVREKSIFANYLEFLEYELNSIDTFVDRSFALRPGNTYETICYTLEFYPSGIVKSLNVEKKNVHIDNTYKTLNDLDENIKPLYNLYRKVALKYKMNITEFDVYRINEMFNYFLNLEYVKFVSKNRLPFIYFGYSMKSDEEINYNLSSFAYILESLDKQDAYDVIGIINGKVDQSHYSMYPFSNGVYEMNLTDHKNYLSLLNQKMLSILYFNDWLIDDKNIGRFRNSLAVKFMQIVDELNEINDYVDQEELKNNKGRIRKKIKL